MLLICQSFSGKSSFQGKSLSKGCCVIEAAFLRVFEAGHVLRVFEAILRVFEAGHVLRVFDDFL